MIRKAELKDFPAILKIVAEARAFLKRSGSQQWQGLYPSKENFLEDYKNGDLYVYEEKTIIVIASLVRKPDVNYQEIYSGKWLNAETYYSIHRIAVKDDSRACGKAKTMLGLLEKIALDEGISNIRLDTAEVNIPMQKLVEKSGYQKCGIIYLKGVEVDNKRIAYQKLLNLTL